jgi:NAD(P)-dependent dehydrogenase (short-subunit alcohol dehydrogenase family)
VHILITGAASGIGKELSLCFAHEEKAVLSLVDIDENGLTEMIKSLKVPTYIYRLDLSDVDAVPAVIQQIERDNGHIDVIINCAGIMFIQTMAALASENYQPRPAIYD